MVGTVRKIVSSITALALAFAMPLTAYATWGPVSNRPIYDWNVDNIGSMNGPVFNSFTNVPAPGYGNEPTFLDARNLGSASSSYSDNLDICNLDEVEVRLYYHNNANAGTNDSGVGIAKNTTVEFSLPTGQSTTHQAAGYIRADNATPTEVWDTVDFDSSNCGVTELEYVPGSAVLTNNNYTSGISLPDSVKSGGALIGYDKLDGNLPGCFQYSGIVTIKMKVKRPDIRISKKIAEAGEAWQELETLQPGDKVYYYVEFQNTGNADALNVKLRDQLPANTTLVSSTTKLFNTVYPAGIAINEADFFGNGVNVGNYQANGGGYVVFQVQIDDNWPEGTQTRTNTAYVTFDGLNGEKNDPADYQVTVVPTPVYDLALTKTVDQSQVAVGDIVNWTIKVENQLDTTATGVEVKDVIPAGLEVISTTPATVFNNNTWNIGTINGGETKTLIIKTKVTQIDSVITNTAEISNMNETDVDSTPGNGVAGEDDIDSASIYPKDADQIDLELTKQVNAEKVSKGQEIEYSLVVTNNGPDQATGVEVLDKLPTGVSFVSSNGDYDSATGIWSVGSLDKGQSKTLTIKVKVNADKDCIVNIAEVSKADQVDIDSTPGNGVAGEDDQADAKVCLDQKVYDLALTKTVDQSQVAVGDIVNWTITVENQLDTTATGVEVKDVIPAGLEVISTTPATVFNNNTWNIGTINGGETKTLIIKTKVTQIDSVITNTAEISNMNETDVDSTPGNGVAGEDDIDSASIYPKDKPVYICKDLDASVTSGQAPLAVEFTGIGQVVNTNITNYQIDFGDGQNDTNSSGVFSHTYQKAGNYTASLVIQTVDGKTAVTEACKVVISVSEQPIDLELDKMVDVTEIALGDQMTYTLTLENKGPGDATGVEVTDKLPSEVEYISSNAPEGTSYDPATGIWTVGQIAKGQTKTLTITVKVIKEVKITNVAEVTKADQEDVDSTPGNHDPIEDDQDKVVVNPVDNTIDLELDKSISTNSTGKGGVLTYQISVTNKGPADATGVKVSDKLPSGVSFISADGQYDPATGIWELGELNAGQTKTLSIKVKVDKTCENKTITNTAEVAKVDQEDIDSTPSNQDASEDDQDSANFRCEKDIVVTNVENVTNVTNTNNVNNVTNTTNQANTTNVAGVSTTTPQVIAQGGKAPVPGTNPVVVPSGTTPATGLASTLSILFASLVLSYLGYSYYQLRKRAEKLGF